MNRKAVMLAGAALVTGTVAARAWENDLSLVATIDVGGKGLGTFDISFVDPKIDLYVLADRTNASVDFVNTETNQFLGRASGFQGQKFKADGVTADNTISGPDGVVIVNHKEVWAGDGDSTLKVVDIKSMSIKHTIKIDDPTHPGATFRVDEMTWDVADRVVVAANNANVPPFISFVNVDSHKVLGQIVFDGNNNTPDATDTGIEQPAWSPKTGLIYVSVPQIVQGTDDASVRRGGISVIDPHTMKVLTTYEVDDCSPAGLTIGPNDHALIGCSAQIGTAPNKTTQTFVINLLTGELSDPIPIGGSDQVWFDRGTNHYYLGARNNLMNGAPDPILGSVDASNNTFDGRASTSTTAHSVAADQFEHKVFVPIGFVPPGSAQGTDPTNPCPEHGCIAVFVPTVADRVAERE